MALNYRKIAFQTYEPFCAYCGFGLQDILEVAHIDGARDNNNLENLVILCPTCHKMLDVDLISNNTIRSVRDRARRVNWGKRMKDAGKKAARTRKLREAGRKAAETRKRNSARNLTRWK
ncbi:MAG: HNH endonuclease [Chloroflexota bacterium]|nr:HNH endonuclease [Chloroflexota bacterium]